MNKQKFNFHILKIYSHFPGNYRDSGVPIGLNGKQEAMRLEDVFASPQFTRSSL